jgi:predicted phosphodiesterase
MRVVLYSDVHAILQAMTALETELGAIQPDAVWFLGDATGRGPSPHRVVGRVRSLQERYSGASILGNHDMDVLGRMSDGGMMIGDRLFTESGFDPVELAQHRDHAKLMKDVTQENYHWLDSLPLWAEPLDGLGFYLAHGYFAPGDKARTIWTYATENEGIIKDQIRTVRAQAHTPPRLIAVGHYHIAGLWQLCDERLIEYDPWADEWVTLDNVDEQPVVLNTGTASFPRRKGDFGNYVILEFDQKSPNQLRIGFRPLPFDWRSLLAIFVDGYPNAEKLRCEIRRNHLPPGILPPEEG